jgi:ABC-type antimicrobial peptide transport system permease subunit
MIISEAVARAMFPGENPIGKRVGCCAANSIKTVIGVMAMALGATGEQVLRLLAWKGLVPIVIGLVIGFGLAVWSARLLQASLYGVSAHDPVTYAAVTAALLLAGILATVVPARRAARVDPIQALQ